MVDLFQITCQILNSIESLATKPIVSKSNMSPLSCSDIVRNQHMKNPRAMINVNVFSLLCISHTFVKGFFSLTSQKSFCITSTAPNNHSVHTVSLPSRLIYLSSVSPSPTLFPRNGKIPSSAIYHCQNNFHKTCQQPFYYAYDTLFFLPIVCVQSTSCNRKCGLSCSFCLCAQSLYLSLSSSKWHDITERDWENILSLKTKPKLYVL